MLGVHKVLLGSFAGILFLSPLNSRRKLGPVES